MANDTCINVVLIGSVKEAGLKKIQYINQHINQQRAGFFGAFCILGEDLSGIRISNL